MRMLLLFLVGTGLAAVATTGVVRTLDDQSDASRTSEIRSDDHKTFEFVSGPSPFLPRTQAKHKIVVAVVCGDIGLWEAGGLVRDLYSNDPNFVRCLNERYPSASDDERYSRVVINGVAGFLWGRPQERATLLDRLEAELDRHLSDGRLHQTE